MKAIYFWILLLVFVGIAISYYLIPSGEDLALIQLKSRKFSQASEFYEEQYEKGNRTPSLVYELSVLYETRGNLDKAIDVIKEYSIAHPHDLEALKRLSDLYYLNNQFEEYDQVLLKMHEMHANLDLDSMRELSDYYQRHEAIKNQTAILKEIISKGKADEGDYVELANAYVMEGKFDQAASVLKTRRNHFVDKNTIDTMLFELWINVKLGKAKSQDIVHSMADFLIKKNDPQLIYYVIGQFKDNYPSLTNELIQLLETEIKKNSRLENEILMIQWDQPDQREKVYQRLTQMEKQAKQNPMLQSFMFNVFLDREDDSHLLWLIQNTSLQRIGEREIIDLAIIARSREKPIMALEMQKALGSKYLQEHPLSALALEIGAQQKKMHDKFTKYKQTHQLTPSEIYSLFQLAIAAHFDQEALELGAQLPPYTGLSEYSLTEIAMAYAQMKQAEALYPLIEHSLPTLGSKKAAPALALLDIALHRTEQAAKWLKEQKFLSEDILKAFYEVAKDNKEYAIDLYIAKRLHQDFPSPSSSSSYGFALVQVGEIENGIAILKRLHQQYPLNTQIQRDYFPALILAAKKDKRYAADLLAFMQERERQSPLPQNMRRDFGYAYLETLHDFQKAKSIFFSLASDSPPKREDVQTLIYLWGPYVPDWQAKWIEKQAEHANLEDLAYWLENLNFIGKFKTTICIFRRHAQQLLGYQAYFAYMQALAYEKRKEELKRAVDITFPMLNTRKLLEELAIYAEEAEYNEARIWIWEKIVTDNSDDPLAWRALAKAQFDARAYCMTHHSLKSFFWTSHAYHPKLYEIFYEYAEVLRKKRCFCGARHYYHLTLNEIATAEKQTAQMKEIAALSYQQVYRKEKGLSLMKEYYKMSGRDPTAAAAYANMLMDNGYLQEAGRFLYDSFVQPESYAY